MQGRRTPRLHAIPERGDAGVLEGGDHGRHRVDLAHQPVHDVDLGQADIAAAAIGEAVEQPVLAL